MTTLGLHNSTSLRLYGRRLTPHAAFLLASLLFSMVPQALLCAHTYTYIRIKFTCLDQVLKLHLAYSL